MANFFTDNEDILFLFEHLDLAEVASAREDGFAKTDGPGADLTEPFDIVNISDLLVLLGAWGGCL